MRTIEVEEVDLSDDEDITNAKNQIGCFIEDVNMTKYIHSLLGYIFLIECEET